MSRLALAGMVLILTGLVPAQASAITPPIAGVLPSAGFRAPMPVVEGAVGVAASPVSLRYTFDGGVRQPITDLAGGHELRPLGQNGGALRLVPQGVGLAVAYPDRCTLTQEIDCPRAILEGFRDDDLNPGTRTLQYGASVLMTHGDLSDGANVLQKGYSVGGVSQFKLQVDHRLGHPSCVITGRTGRIYRAEPWIDVADGRWHDLTCVRANNRLTTIVDGVPRAWVRVPPRVSIANAEPLRVGGKGPAQGNDQYAGEIDNVFLTIGD
ncbi:LamG-like jellyroll fold domain-containing protein [Actinoplanes sp. CA-142083]|uniref:LamG-like jellyroll fold domain-containing protein n=1 Tax=Actinoplanes sp. CA-142083 TaxID=3239903 RepID=UPI003D8B7D3D